MEYIGKLYGKFNDTYFDTCKTSEDFDALVNENIKLKEQLSNVKLHFIDSINDMYINTHSLGCGLEDCGITDRYRAMEYGVEQTMLMVIETIDRADIK